VTLTFDTRARMAVLVTLLVLAGAVAAFMAYQRLHDSSGGSSAAPVSQSPVTKPPAVHATKPKPVPTHTPTAKPAKVAATPNKAPVTAKAKAKPAPAPPNQLPLPIRRALARDRIVVVALFDPGAKIDGAALGEAQAGALLAGSSFVKVNVNTNAVDSLNARYGAVQDPAVIVLRPPGDLVVRIDGFADRDTVAQAALNAAA
jgi:hypothetical protein